MVVNSGVSTICWFDTQDLFSSRFSFFKYGLEVDLPLFFIELPGLFFVFASFSRRVFPENVSINHGQTYDFGDLLRFNLNVLDAIPIASVEQHISMNRPRTHRHWASKKTSLHPLRWGKAHQDQADVQEVGRVLSVGDGIARIYGLKGVKAVGLGGPRWCPRFKWRFWVQLDL